ncbi:MFS transporter [Aeromicrobium halocynthiae]|uniref:MFS transporter n=1 Tax=Aeromicrobium halocynthiae TaxID=560557 RepID=A0ABN2VVI6_9ACTN
MTTPATRTLDRERRPSRLLVPALALTVMVTAVLQTVVVPILGVIEQELQASRAAVGWAVTVNLLAAAVLTPLLSRIGDLHGRRRVLIGILTTLCLGSLLAAVTTSLPLLLVARALQGAAFGLFPLSIGVLRDTIPADRLTTAMAVVSGTIGFGGGIGLVLTGLLTGGGGDYHRVFWLSLAVCAIALALVVLTVPPDGPREDGRVDWAGGLLLGTALVLLLLPISQGLDWGWASLPTVSCVGAAVGVLVLWTLVERRVREPLVALTVLANRVLATTHLAGLVIGFSMFVAFLGISAFVQVPTSQGYGFSATVLETSCLYLLPAALIGVASAPVGGRLVRRFDARAVLALSSLVGAGGFLFMAIARDHPWQLVLGGVLTNGAVTMGFATLPALVVSQVRADQTSVATGVNSIARSFGSALGSALVVALLSTGGSGAGSPPDEKMFVISFLVGGGLLTFCALFVAVGLPRHAEPVVDVAQGDEEAAVSLATEWALPADHPRCRRRSEGTASPGPT